ncbi:MAG: hypothetical protein JXC85_00755 [Candidatus Aenigmarchaeota archaeon]|nr:hypothetical protein [Candidatus Aenigmarchaeota archaeon]
MLKLSVGRAWPLPPLKPRSNDGEAPTRDVLLHLSRVFMLKMGNEWVLSEVPKKPRVMLEKMGMENILRKFN